MAGRQAGRQFFRLDDWGLPSVILSGENGERTTKACTVLICGQVLATNSVCAPAAAAVGVIDTPCFQIAAMIISASATWAHI